MRTHSLLHYAYATVTSIALLGLGSVAYAQNLPSYMEPITGRTSSSPAGTATKNVLALNTGMFELYGDAAKPGMYVYRTKLQSGSKNPPHWHPEERTVTIISGTLYYAVGETWDDTKFVAHPAGTFFSEPPRMPHSAWAKDVRRT